MRRILLLVVSALMFPIALVAAAGSAGAAPAVCSGSTSYPFTPAAELQVSATVVKVGATVKVSGTHFCPDETVTLTIDGTVVGTARTDASGDFDPPVVVPGPAGSKQVCGTGGTKISTNADCLTITASAVAPVGTNAEGADPAVTGVQVALLVVGGLLLLSVGVAFAFAGRRRSTDSVA